jgi:glycosyltransferase involved in cell wall biosynthesis
VVVPTYNRAGLVERAVRSVLAQTVEELEVLVVDDASTDGTGRVVEALADARIRYVRHPEKRGGARARNTGIDLATGDYVAFLDSDDEWLPRKIEAQLDVFAEAGERVGAVYCPSLTDRGHGPVPRRGTLHRGDVHDVLLGGWCPPTTSLFVLRRTVLDAGHRFDPELPGFQDLDLWLRISREWEFDYAPEPLVVQHAHGGARVSTDPEARERALGLLLARWEPEMRRLKGTEGVRAFRRKHETAWRYQAALERARDGDRVGALRAFAPLLRHGRLRPGQVLRMTAALMGLYDPLQRVRTRLRS